MYLFSMRQEWVINTFDCYWTIFWLWSFTGVLTSFCYCIIRSDRHLDIFQIQETIAFCHGGKQNCRRYEQDVASLHGWGIEDQLINKLSNVTSPQIRFRLIKKYLEHLIPKKLTHFTSEQYTGSMQNSWEAEIAHWKKLNYCIVTFTAILEKSTFACSLFWPIWLFCQNFRAEKGCNVVSFL